MGEIKEKLTDSEVKFVESAVDACRSRHWASLLYFLILRKKPKLCLELGTCIGISTAYQALALKENGHGQIFSIDKVPGLSLLAGVLMEKSEFTDYSTLIVDDFSSSLKHHIGKIGMLDFVFVDGDHVGEKTIEYFEILSMSCSEGAVIVFDDIRWSKSMKKAWKKIRKHKSVSLSVDLYFQGIVIINSKTKPKKHYFCPLLIP